MDGAQGVPSINRREFLQTTAIAGCVLLLSDPLTALAEGETLEIGRMTGGIQSERGKTCRLPLANWNGKVARRTQQRVARRPSGLQCGGGRALLQYDFNSVP